MTNRPAERAETCDVLVIGAGTAGYCAAIAAGRQGAHTILLELDSVLGGNAGPNCGVGITGADRHNPYGSETGIIHAIHEASAWIDAYTHVDKGSMPYNTSRRFEALVQEYLAAANVRVLKRHFAHQPMMAGNRIDSVLAQDLAAFQDVRIKVNHTVIDASGDGHIAWQAGADFRMGSEARSAHDERSAPDEASNETMGTSLVALAIRTDHEVTFVPPVGTPSWQPRTWNKSLTAFMVTPHDWLVNGDHNLVYLYVTETGGEVNTITDDGPITERLLGQLWAEWDQVKNGSLKEQAKNWDILWVSPRAGKRESRRFLGDVILTQQDLEMGRKFPDDIGYGGHGLDDHQVCGDQADIHFHSVPPMYGIPLRACYSRNVDNLFLAGRLMSATHLAFSSTRVMRTGAAVGEAVGVAAAMTREYACSPRAIYETHLDELQNRLLHTDVSLLRRPTPAGNDRAPEAAVAATSEATFNAQEPGTGVPLLRSAGNILWDWPEAMRTVTLHLKNPTPDDQELTLRIHHTPRPKPWSVTEAIHGECWDDLDYATFAERASCKTTIPAGFCGWHAVTLPAGLSLPAKDATCDGDRVLITLDRNPNLIWSVLPGRTHELMVMIQANDRQARWAELPGVGTMQLDPAPRLGEAANLIDGFTRRFSRGPTHMWMSDPGGPLPQEVSLTWDAPQSIDTVTITFDNLGYHRDLPWQALKRAMPYLVKDYELLVRNGDAWEVVARETGNCHRFRQHRFAVRPARAVKLRVLATHGEDQPARVYQIRAEAGTRMS